MKCILFYTTTYGRGKANSTMLMLVEHFSILRIYLYLHI